MDFDRADKAIISALQENARLTNVELADRAGLSASACLRRTNMLEEKGLIASYHAEINAAMLGYEVVVLLQITLTGQASEMLREFESAVVKIPNVLACFLMTGTKDYILRVTARSVADYEQVHSDHLATLPHVQSMESNFILRTVINRGLPVGLI